MTRNLRSALIAFIGVGLLCAALVVAFRFGGGQSMAAGAGTATKKAIPGLKPWPAEVELKPWPAEVELKPWPAEVELKPFPTTTTARAPRPNKTPRR